MSQVDSFSRPPIARPVHPSGSVMKPLVAAVLAAIAQQQAEAANERQFARLKEAPWLISK